MSNIRKIDFFFGLRSSVIDELEKNKKKKNLNLVMILNMNSGKKKVIITVAAIILHWTRIMIVKI